MNNIVSSWHIGVAGEAFAAAQFARLGYYVSVQYGANQPEYDLMAQKYEMVDGQKVDRILKISVKASKDGGWGLTQGYLKNGDYQKAITDWLSDHGDKTVFCLVQFENIKDNELPRIYLATPQEIAEVMRNTANGRGDTILYENHTWTNRAYAAGTTDKIPEEWLMTAERTKYIFDLKA